MAWNGMSYESHRLLTGLTEAAPSSGAVRTPRDADLDEVHHFRDEPPRHAFQYQSPEASCWEGPPGR